MHTTFRTASVVGLLLASVGIAAQTPAPGENVNFVSCPVMRDTDTVPCWLAEHDGELFFLGMQTDASGWPAPYLKHQVLVEGTVADMPRVCGGIVLESSDTPFVRSTSGQVYGMNLPNPPVTSNMREIDLSCNTILPASAQFNNVEPRRGPGPNVFRAPISAEERAAQRARIEAARAASKPVPPYKMRSFVLNYEFDSELATLTIGEANSALNYAREIGADRIVITGYRASTLLSSGEQLEELDFMAKKRAEEIAQVVRQLGVPEGTSLDVNWVDQVIAGDGKNDWEGRKTEITVYP